MCLWPSGSPTWRKRTSEFCFAALAEYPERAMVLVRDEPEAAGGASDCIERWGNYGCVWMGSEVVRYG